MTTQAPEQTGRVNPKKFSLWLLLLGILMLFSGLTSATSFEKEMVTGLILKFHPYFFTPQLLFY